MPTYDNKFFKYVNSGAIDSAKEILPMLLKAIPIKSVLDVGCGQGAWLSVWKKLGVTDISGIDGGYVERNNLLIDQEDFNSYDLSNGFNLNRRFDLVQSLEVAEHLPESSAKGFVGARKIIFSVGNSSSLLIASINAISVFPIPVGRTTRQFFFVQVSKIFC